MIHLGDITQIDWSAVPPVDVVTGGSPCQDLSVAGKRAGLAGERSGLFMEQIRCIKELRKADEKRGRTGQLIRPRYMVWENVPGAFSSNKGEDFRAVLEEAARIIQPAAIVPGPPGGKWRSSGTIVGDRWSLAWRVHDAQFWGVAQRRRRISLVCDFAGWSAPEVLFERKGVSWNPQEGRAQREETAGGAGKGIDSASEPICIEPRSQDGCARIHEGGVTPTLNTAQGGQRTPCVTIPINMMVATKTSPETRTTFGIGQDGEPQFTISSTHSHAVCAGFSFGQSEKARSIGYQEEKSPTLRGGEGGNQKPCVLSIGNGQLNQIPMSETANTLDTMHDQQAVLVTAVDCRNARETPEVNGTLQSKEQGYNMNSNNVCRIGSVVRRLTPLECERLQGYPDGWTDIGEWTDSKGKRHKAADTPRYKALGNSIALPFWFWLLRRIAAQYYRPATLGSLFDGIGGFPLCWERCNGPGTALWASEIEEFPIAVTKERFK